LSPAFKGPIEAYLLLDEIFENHLFLDNFYVRLKL